MNWFKGLFGPKRKRSQTNGLRALTSPNDTSMEPNEKVATAIAPEGLPPPPVGQDGEPFPPSWLDDTNNPGLGRLPIPQSRDFKITELIRIWVSWDDSTRLSAAHRISKDHFWTMLCYAERMASLAVREGQEELVFLAS